MAVSLEMSSPTSNALSWESFLPSHAIFKSLGKEVKLPSEKPYLGRNILVEQDGDLFLWDDDKKRICVANLRNLKAKNERSSKFQTLLCTSPPSFSVSKMVFSETGAYLALVGKHGICVLELPQKRGTFTEFEHGKDTISCRTVHLDERFFTCHQTITIFDAKWYPGSSGDVHLVVLTSDNRIRLFDITTPTSPESIITVGTVPSDQSLCSPTNATFAEAFGEVVVAFDFAPAVDVELLSDATIASNSEVAHPVFLLQENGDMLYLLLILTENGFYYELHGYLSVFPPAEDNYGVDSCAVLCFPTNPVVVAIATCSGTIYHCIALDAEEDEGFGKTLDDDVDVTKDERHVNCLTPKISLYVYECMELALTPSSDIEGNFDESRKSSSDNCETKEDTYSVNLFKDPASGSRYHCYHASGVYTVTLPWLRNLQQFCHETDTIVSFDPNQDGKVQHLICTNPVPSSPLNLTGFTVVSEWDLGATIIALTDNMECITKPLRFLNRPPSPLQLPSERDTDDGKKSSRQQPHAGEFENRIKYILRRDSSNPILRSGSDNTSLPPKECFQFLAGATETFRLEYINKQKLAQEEIERRVDLLKAQSKKQHLDLIAINDEKESLRDHMTTLAEKYEDTKDRQEDILVRIHKVSEYIQSRQPILSDAEVKMRDELSRISRNIQTFKRSFDQLKSKQKYLRNKRDRTSEPKERTLSERHQRQLRTMLQREGDTIQDLVEHVNSLKLQVGF